MKIRGYIFDLDDTLYREHDYVRSGFREVARYLSEEFPTVSQETLYGAIIQEWEENGRGRIFDRVCERFALKVEISTLVQMYRFHDPVLDMYEDAKSLLAKLKQDGYKTGLITDGTKDVQWRKVRALRLEEKLDCIVVSDDLGTDCWKPSEVPYRKVVECLELPFEQCVYIGDNPHKDFCTARKLGMHTIRVIRPVGDHMQTMLTADLEADRIVYSLDELVKELDGNV